MRANGYSGGLLITRAGCFGWVLCLQWLPTPTYASADFNKMLCSQRQRNHFRTQVTDCNQCDNVYFSSLHRTIFIAFRERREKERERERERKSNIHMRDKHQSVAFWYTPQQGVELATRFVLWLGIEPATLWSMGWCSNQLSQGSMW